MNDFQQKCIEKCKIFLKTNLNMDISFEHVIGKSETYYRGAIECHNHLIEIYIYDNEAGFMIDGQQWTICERPDYQSTNDLIESFISKLEVQLVDLNA